MSKVEQITDKEIQTLIERPKEIDKTKLRGVLQGGFIHCKCKVDTKDGNLEQFFVLGRVNEDNRLNFSWILTVEFSDSSNMILVRCNGTHGVHRNSLEKKTLRGMHIHKATSRYIRAGKHPESFAVEAGNAYHDAESALDHFMTLCQIKDKSMSLF